jgi:hypothetical protein
MLNQAHERTIGGTVHAPTRPSMRRALPRRTASRPQNRGMEKAAIWLCMIGALIPAADVTIFVGGLKFTAGRLAILSLLLPALIALTARGRKLLAADLLILAVGAWMMTAAAMVGGEGTLSSAGAESLEFVGGYFAARAFIRGSIALSEFVKIMKAIMVLMIAMAMAEHATGTLIIHNIVAGIFHTVPPDAQYRNGLVRATATFDHAILFGAFCAFSAIIFLFAEANTLKRMLWFGLSGYGCLLSQSSSAVMTLTIALTVYVYDRGMRRYPWRWSLFWGLAMLPMLALMALSQRPLHWILSHLTYDPASGFFRLMIWDAAIDKIGQAPFVGHGFGLLGDPILDATVDSVWLVVSLRFGLPVVALLILASMAAWHSAPHRRWGRPDVAAMERMATAFTLVLAMFMFVGLTVHYWNYMWIFWGICIGIRASLREWLLVDANKPAKAKPA